MDKIESARERLKAYVEKHDYRGFDLYDGLKVTDRPFILNNYFLNTLISQFFKRCPLNLRKAVGIRESKMPKAVGIFLRAYAQHALFSADARAREESLGICRRLHDWLIRHSLKNYAGSCWNFGFNYKFMFDKPTVVITAIIARGLFDYFKITGGRETGDALLSTVDFILRDLHRTETEEGICFSYTPIRADCCYNANMLAAETLARVYHLDGNRDLLGYIRRAVDFTVAHQEPDGRWNYSIDMKTGRERGQVDFHQGYILESLAEIMALTGMDDPRYRDSLERGAAFYRRHQFFEDGRSKWRWPKVWPVDIHHQAQGIITFCRLKALDPGYLEFARRIAAWTVDHLQDPAGCFYYQKHRLYTNRIAYMRWSQAWMLLALTMISTG